MKKIALFICLAAVFTSCTRHDKTETSANAGHSASGKDLPYTASYSSNWSDNVSDADLKMVMMTYKDWETGNLKGLGAAMGDSVTYEMSSGKHQKLTNAELMKLWTTTRDSLKSVKIVMDAWHKMYSTDKKEGYVVTWYKETDTYKNGKVDSAYYHDINQVKDGKIVWYSQYKRPARP